MRLPFHRTVVGLFAVLLVAAPSFAQLSGVSPQSGVLEVGKSGEGSTDGAATPIAGPPRVSAIRIDVPPVLDGSLDDAAWERAAKITQFVQERPLEGAVASEATEVYVAYDSQRIYIGVYAHYTDSALIRANRSDRDRIDRDDTVAVYFDPFLDQQRGYSFSVNAYGIQADALLSSSGGGGGFGGGGGGGGAVVLVAEAAVLVAAVAVGAAAEADEARAEDVQVRATRRGTRFLNQQATWWRTDGRPRCRFHSRAFAIRPARADNRTFGVSRFSAVLKAKMKASCGRRFRET